MNPPGPLGTSGGSIAHLREHNLSQILLALAAESPLSRSKIAARTGLGITAMTKLIAELRDRQLVAEVSDTNPAAMGRPTTLIALARHHWATASLSLDNGTIHVAIGGIDGKYNTTFSIPTPVSLEIDEYINYVGIALNQIAEECRNTGRELLAVEAAIPGAANNSSGVMMRSILNGWSRPYPLRQVLLNLLSEIDGGVSPSILVGIDRATNYSLLSRLRDLDLPGEIDTAAHLGGLYAVSGGIYSRSALEHGSTGLAGEFGHFVIDPAGAQCWCGRRGCVETRLGLAGIYARCSDSGTTEANLVPQLAQRHEEMVENLLARARSGERLVLQELDRAGYWLGITVDTIAAVVNPRVLVVDGYLAALQEFLRPEMDKQLASIGSLPSITDLGITFAEDPFVPVNRGMQIAAGLAVAQHPGAAAH
ncbi:ROK family protein [Paeniglutamicibacter sp. NPDC012692]|uniref:ROK family transcriptional regulator n=1 Tax=Paeniglutamicibacter sp. NPDC012692 TaxID=3364388 RepID=UPI0036A43B73